MKFKSAILASTPDGWTAQLTLNNSMTLRMKGTSLDDICAQLCDWERRVEVGPDAFED